MPSVLKPFLGRMVYTKIPTNRKELFLTFDDGPTAGITRQILDLLDEYNARATFFCIGGNVVKQPEVFSEMQSRGHAVGNHTWNHMSGWEFSDFSYFKNILECSRVVPSPLFRPPYGKISPRQIPGIAKRYKIIMWDVLAGDWDASISPEQCLRNVTDHAEPGSVIVFHDSAKARDRMLYALPRALEFWSKQGFSFRKIEPHHLIDQPTAG